MSRLNMRRSRRGVAGSSTIRSSRNTARATTAIAAKGPRIINILSPRAGACALTVETGLS